MPSREHVHELTHEPFQPWCKACVRFRARQDKHPSEHQHADSGRTTISMDFGYLSREPEAEDQLTCLFLKDRFTQFLLPEKGDQASRTWSLKQQGLWFGWAIAR